MSADEGVMLWPEDHDSYSTDRNRNDAAFATASTSTRVRKALITTSSFDDITQQQKASTRKVIWWTVVRRNAMVPVLIPQADMRLITKHRICDDSCDRILSGFNRFGWMNSATHRSITGDWIRIKNTACSQLHTASQRRLNDRTQSSTSSVRAALRRKQGRWFITVFKPFLLWSVYPYRDHIHGLSPCRSSLFFSCWFFLFSLLLLLLLLLFLRLRYVRACVTSRAILSSHEPE